MSRTPHDSDLPRLAILGGGQLAKMTALAGWPLGVDVTILQSPGRDPQELLPWPGRDGDWNEGDTLVDFAEWARPDVVTLENEFVDADALEALERAGVTLRPGAATIATVQDKLVQKQTLEAAGLAVPAFADAPTRDAVAEAGARFGWPLILKARRNGYDGKGNARVEGPDGIEEAWAQLDGDHRALFAEAFCPFRKELAVMIARRPSGETCRYPVVETVQKDHICHVVRAPAAVSDARAEEAGAIAEKAVEAIGGVGSVGIEMFLTEDGGVLINELAPRVHNSGHYSIEACDCSQFENHVRAVFDWPLGRAALRAPAAVMINLLGAGEGGVRPAGLEEALAIPGAHVHLYGKSRSRPGRKMGHVTALGATVEEAEATARRAADLIRFGKENTDA